MYLSVQNKQKDTFFFFFFLVLVASNSLLFVPQIERFPRR